MRLQHELPEKHICQLGTLVVISQTILTLWPIFVDEMETALSSTLGY